MKASIILTTILTTSAWAGTLPTKRQNAANEAALQQAREDSVKAIEGGQGRGRLLLDEGNCSEACNRCRASAVATAVAEVFACGTAAVAIDVLTAGIATFLEAAGFVACEAAVVSTLNEKEETCLKE
ncbi:uncharacterized protein FPRO_15680 [Fusarium proliferatum ET1]|uniref:Uncharacterized protein n=3 Tax=Fusarium fujikuroi species complex TaxID=171627 RepID=A0A8H5U7Q5_9HYPO|nr:uncharacterized protein FPRO_15680 [Fusarium proliferatum ET1]KAF5684236.1 hypothetical protein FGLOB1_14842 [Fusarium globosum]KAG4262760.1 hypothetical protein FPRO03_10123 [Fusarium proliferatum]RBA18317.1 hypothetical protein FPRO05_10612 [Fusarium proliferatum]RKL41563.1 hypothetical protein BFJ72_g5455 [Fusarium proliferatum]CZR45145.1 uncharacterized protein FPRO_15680 [Fusarium proliferatum ET1]